MTQKNEPVRHQIVTGPVRIAFPHLFEARAPKGEDVGKKKPRFECVLLVPPSTDDGKLLASTIKKALADAFGPDWETEMTAIERAKLPLKKAADNKWFRDQFADWHYMNAWSYDRPGVIMPDLSPVMDREQIYAGCWCRFQLTLFGWETPRAGKLCIPSLDNVMFVKDGERIRGGGKQDAAAAFKNHMEFTIPTEMGSAADETPDLGDLL